MILRWFLSEPYRQARELRKQVRRELHLQRDLLTERARNELEAALGDYDAQLRTRGAAEALTASMKALEQAAVKWLQPYENASARDNLREFLVSAVLILSIFTFFVQPMKIPTGSAQPTLYGNVVTDLRGAPAGAIPDRWHRFLDWFRGFDYHEWTAKADGVLRIERPSTTLGFIKQQRFMVGDDTYSIWWPPDNMLEKSGLHDGMPVRKGESILRLRIGSGDRLFIDRMSYNFRRPDRGETIVFNSTGIPKLTQNTHYIKRLVGLSGDKIRIGDDRHAIINGERLDAATPGFENVYTFSGPPQDSVYSGHVNEVVARLARRERNYPPIAPFFPDENTEFQVRKNHYLAFGDNTMNSYDGRGWGDFPRQKVVGRALFVFWPFTGRFGPVMR